MKRITFFRLRQIWLPTFSGWILILVIGIVLCVLVARNIYSFLAQNEPVGARILVVEGWLAAEELDQAAQTFKAGNYARVVTTGGPLPGGAELSRYGNYAKQAAEYLAQQGIPLDAILVAPTPASAQDRTFLSAVMLRKSVQKLGITLDAIDVFSSGAHARRSRLLYQMALGHEVRVGVMAARPNGYGLGTWSSPENWWRTSHGTESIITQSIGLIWVKCCFWPGPPGSQNELWATH